MRASGSDLIRARGPRPEALPHFPPFLCETAPQSGNLRPVDISADQVRAALFYVLAFVVSVSVHEFGHAFVADRLGDRNPRLQGRLTLSPLAHIEPIGTLAVPLLGVLVGLPLFAWGKPVQTNPANYTRRFSMRTGSMLVAAAGPFMNLVLAFVGSVAVSYTHLT